MKKEILDIVNNRNKVIGCAPRPVFFLRGLWHRVSHTLVLNENGKIFIAQRHPKLKIHPCLWGGVDETVKAGESYLAAAARGLEEEMGARREKESFEKIKEVKYKWFGKGLKNNEIVQIFIVHFSGPARISHEHTNFKWLKYQAILKRKNLTPTLIKTLFFYHEYRKKQNLLFKKFQREKDTLWILGENKVKYKDRQKGIKPLVRLLNQKQLPLKYKIVFDKIIGRAAALLLVYAGVSEVHAVLGSRAATKVFLKYKVYFQFQKTVPRILNQEKCDICPFEKRAKNKTPVQFYKMVKNKY